MVILNKIYTRTGDEGTTALGTGARVPKQSPRIDAYGIVDETNAVIGIARLSLSDDAELDAMVARKAAESGFTAVRQVLEIEGLCNNCRGDATTA